MRHEVLITPTVVAASLLAGLVVAASLGSAAADAWSGPLAIAALVLVLSGVAKIATPSAATSALEAAGLPPSPALVRLVGAAEVALGVVAGSVGGPLAAAGVAVAYAAFAVVAWRMATDPTVASCGCFGATDARPGPLHVGVDVAAAVAATGAALAGSGGLVGVVRDTPAAGIPALVGVVVGALAVVAVLTVAAEALDAAAGTPRSRSTFHLVEERR